MKWFRQTLRKNRIFILTLLAFNVFHMVEGQQFIYAHQVHQQKEDRLRELSELLDIPVEKLRQDHDSGSEDPVKAAGLERLQGVLRKQQELQADNPYRPQVEAVKQEYAFHRLEGALNDLGQLTQPTDKTALPEASQKALIRNLDEALQEDLSLPVPESLNPKARAKLTEFQNKLDRVIESVRPIVARPRQADAVDALAQRIDQLKLLPVTPTKRASHDPRFGDRPLPVDRVEKKARTEQVSSATRTGRTTSTPAVSRSSAARGIPNKEAVAAEIAELAASLENSPARIFRYVHDSIDFDPKWGAVRGALGTLWEQKGTSWDQAWLLRDLLMAAGVDARFEWGEVEISTEQLTNITGVDDPFRAGDLLTTAGVPIVLLVEGSQVIAARMSHVWVKAFLDYIPDRGAMSGPGDTWIRMDPSLKNFEYQEGVPVHQQVPFTLGDYLLSGTAQSPQRYYADALDAYNIDEMLWVTLEQIKRTGAIVEERFPFVPGTLRAEILTVAGEATDAPETFQHRVTLEARTAAGGPLATWSAALPALYGQRVEVAYSGATASDQATIDDHGGIFETPPYLIDLKPEVRVAGATVATGAAIGSAENTEIWVTLEPVTGSATTLVHDTLAGEQHVLALDLGRVPQAVLDQHLELLNAAVAAADDSAVEAETLFLLGAQYMHDLGRDLDDLSGWKWHRLVKLGTEGLISLAGEVTTSIDGTPISFRRAGRNIDVARMILGSFPIDGDSTYSRDTFELLGAQSSFLEGEIFEQVVEEEGIASVSALTRSLREGQTLTRVDSANVSAVLAQVDLGDEVEAAVNAAVGQGQIAWVAESPITVNSWTGTGYVLEDPSTGAAGYLISGALAGGTTTVRSLRQALRNFFGSEGWLGFDDPLAIVKGALGLFLACIGRPPGPQAQAGDPVNLATGNFWIMETDLRLRARGIAAVWSRTYNSQLDRVGLLGHGWSSTYEERLEEQPDGAVVLVEGDGTEHVFTADGSGGYLRPPGKFLTLTREAGGFELRAKTGIVRSFTLDGRLITLADPNGNSLTVGYNGAGNLETLTDSEGRTLITVTTVDGKITRLDDHTGRSVVYGYTGDDLTSVRDLAGETWTYAYDSAHNLIARSDPLGNTHSYAYDAQDRCYRYTDPLGHSETFAYSSIGRRAVHTDRRGAATFVELDERGRAITGVDALGNVARSTWDDDNNRTAIIDPKGGTTSTTYDDQGNILTLTDALDNTTTFTYDPEFSRVLTVTDAREHTLTYAYDASGNMTSATQVVGGETFTETFTYDSTGLLLEERNAGDHPMTVTWDTAKGEVMTIANALDEVMTLTHDALSRPTAIIDPTGSSATMTYDDADRIASLTDPYDEASTFTYDAAGRRTEVTTSVGTLSTEYDALGRPVATTDPLGNTRRMEYDEVGNITARIDARGNRTSTVYDLAGRPVAIIDPLGNVWSFDYFHDIGGNCSSCGANPAAAGASSATVIDPLGNRTLRHFDVLGQLTEVSDPLGHHMEIAYDALGRRESITDDLDRTTSFEHDELGRLTAVVDASGSRTEYSYDKSNNLTEVLDAEGHLWLRAYDPLNRLSSVTDPLDNSTTFAYDVFGNMTRRQDANGEVVTFDYDRGRLLAVNLPGGATETHSYDAKGRRTTMASADSSVTFAYDALDRIVSVSDQILGKTIDYTYDANGNVTEIQGPESTITLAYDAKNRLVAQNDSLSGNYRFAYDALDRRRELLYPNGTTAEWDFDAGGHLLSLITRDPLGDVLDGYSYTYDGAGNRLTKNQVRDNMTETYAYDEVDRLTSWHRGGDRIEQFTYDKVGNRLTRLSDLGLTTYAYDDANRLTSEVFDPGGSPVTTTYEWDANGNLTRRAAATETLFSYDPRDRLTRVTAPQGIFEYGYSPDGIRVRETEAGQTRRSLLAFEDVVGLYDQANALEIYYGHGPGIDEPLAQVAGGSLEYLHRDALGSVTALSNGTGQLAGTATFAAFGARESTSGATSLYGFTGREHDPTGLTYYRSRYMDPGVGRFLTQDTFDGNINMPSSLHRYTYVHNNPVNFTDPNGTFIWLAYWPLVNAYFYLIGEPSPRFANCLGFVSAVMVGGAIKILWDLTAFPPAMPLWFMWWATAEWLHDQNECMFAGWQSQANPAWRQSQSICAASGWGSTSCCQARINGEQTGYNECIETTKRWGKLSPIVKIMANCPFDARVAFARPFCGCE